MKFSDLITTEDQYEVNKARASLSFHTNMRLDQFYGIFMVYFPSYSMKVR